MKEVKVSFSPEDLQRLTAEATASGVSRAELIRSRALVTDCQHGVAALDTLAYHRLVTAAVRSCGGALPRHLVEQIVIYVLIQLSQPKADTSIQSAA
jgi:hypothetical protein